jgi:hypothetical protein
MGSESLRGEANGTDPSSTQGQIKALSAGKMLDNVLKADPLFEHE